MKQILKKRYGRIGTIRVIKIWRKNNQGLVTDYFKVDGDQFEMDGEHFKVDGDDY